MISDRSKLENPYEDHLATIIDYRDLTSDTRYYKLKFVDPEIQKHTGDYRPGQFAMFSIPGVGEAPFSISSTPTRPAFLEFGIRKVGSFTDTLFKKKEGDTVYIRGPYGNGFDMVSMEGKDIVIVSGGLGAVPLRSVLLYLEDKRELYNNIFFLNGARTPDDMLFKEDFLAMHAREIIETHLTVD
ncbi:MAG: FAD-binding oxidoreductase, partial [Candidatus Heimdallarchaeaceae archaeon]